MSKRNSHESKTKRRHVRHWVKGEDFRCWNCNTSTLNEHYMVKNDVWDSGGIDRDKLLCIGCLESRIGRELTGKDFMLVPLNYIPYPRSERLINRLQTLPECPADIAHIITEMAQH